MPESELFEIYARGWTEFDPSIVEPYLADSVVLWEEITGVTRNGKADVVERLRFLIEIFGNTGRRSDKITEIGERKFTRRDGFSSTKQLKRCVLRSIRGRVDSVDVLETNGGAIERIEIYIADKERLIAVLTGNDTD